jgi:hypothetical protein
VYSSDSYHPFPTNGIIRAEGLGVIFGPEIQFLIILSIPSKNLKFPLLAKGENYADKR